MKRDLIVILFLSAIMFTSYHFTMANEPRSEVDRHSAYHQAVINGTATSPGRYRVLMPFIAEAVASNLPYQPRAARELVAYSLLHMIILPLSMWALYDYVTSASSRVGGLLAVGVYFIAWPLILVGIYHWFTIYAPTELLLFCLALKRVHKPGVFAALMIVAILNRETGVLLAVAYFLVHWRQWSAYSMLIAGIVAVAAIRLWLGSAPHAAVALNSVRGGLDLLYSQVITFNLFFLPLWILAVRGWKRANHDLQRLAYVAVIYALLLVWFASLREVRLYLTFLPFVVPLIDIEKRQGVTL